MIIDLHHTTVFSSIDIRLFFAATPAPFRNVTIIPSSVHALIQWTVEDSGGYPLENITIRYKEKGNENKEWQYVHSQLISQIAVIKFVLARWYCVFDTKIHNFVQSQADVYKLNPNSTYLFQIWGSNKLGSGGVTSITAKTLHDNQEIGNCRQ